MNGAIIGLAIGAGSLLLTGVLAAFAAVKAYGGNVEALSTLTAEVRAARETLAKFGERLGDFNVRLNTVETRSLTERDERFSGKVRG